MSFVTAVLMAYEPAKRLAKMRVNIETGMRMVDMMYQVLDRPIEVTEKPDAKTLARGKGLITFTDVNFGYKSTRSVLSDLSLSFDDGKTTGTAIDLLGSPPTHAPAAARSAHQGCAHGRR